MSEARQALRQVLRAVDQYLTSVNGNKQWRNHIIEEFRRAAAISNPELQRQKLREAKDYAHLVTSVQEHRVRLGPTFKQQQLQCYLLVCVSCDLLRCRLFCCHTT